ncbi:MAG TPA: hypothetical protein VJN90_07110 [Candidatus Acidoferrales bacterium]|nr:hypothetical protein [Candidatus Acidoferrales bacterium]
MPSFRTKSISTKVSDEEYAQIEKLAGEQTISEWTRDVLLKATKPNGCEQIVLAEVIALRTIILNAFYKLAQNEPLTTDEMQRLIAHADESKSRKAQERLAANANRGAE